MSSSIVLVVLEESRGTDESAVDVADEPDRVDVVEAECEARVEFEQRRVVAVLRPGFALSASIVADSLDGFVPRGEFVQEVVDVEIVVDATGDVGWASEDADETQYNPLPAERPPVEPVCRLIRSGYAAVVVPCAFSAQLGRD